MEKFDVGIEGELKFRINGIEAVNGETARDEAVKRFNEFLGTLSKFSAERVWFQPSVQADKQS